MLIHINPALCGVIYIKQMGEFFVLIKDWPQSVKTQSAGPQSAGFMCTNFLISNSEVKIVLHKSSFKNYDFETKFKEKVHKVSKILKILQKEPNTNFVKFLLHKINFQWKISMSVKIFSLEVLDFGVSRSSIRAVPLFRRSRKNKGIFFGTISHGCLKSLFFLPFR